MNIPQDTQNVINEISSTVGGRGDYSNLYKISQCVIDRNLLRVYQGEMFSAISYYSLAAGATASFLIKTPTNKSIHSIVSATGTVEFEGISYEGVTVTGNGTLQTPFNRNRNSTNTPTLLIYSTPTGVNTTGSTIIRHIRLGSGKTLGGDDKSLNEIISKKNTLYYLTVTNQSNQTGYFTSEIFWYETDD